MYDQAVIFDYNLQLVPGSDVVLVMDYIASQLHRDLSETYLDCEYQLADGETPRDFYINALSSLPVDVVRDNTKTVCEDGVSDADCYLVDAAYLTKIFYLEEWRRRLQVNTDFSDDAVLESFNATLVQFFASGSLMSGMSTILNTSFVGITNTGENGDDDRTDDEPFTNDDVPNRRDDDTVAPVADTDRSLNGGAIAGSVVGAIVGVALLVSLVFFALFRRRDSNSKEASKPMDVTQPDISDFRDLMTDPSDERDDRAMLSAAADRSCVVSDDEGSILSGPYERQDFRHVAVILGDDQSFGSGFPLYEPDAFTKRINENNAEHQDPSFVKTDEILDSLHQADMMAQTRSKFGVRSTGSSSRERRGYGAPDTVQL